MVARDTINHLTKFIYTISELLLFGKSLFIIIIFIFIKLFSNQCIIRDTLGITLHQSAFNFHRTKVFIFL